ncbi:MAG: hypothetical protein KDK70_33950, partial [Myxococcales bacterium]|nr:hypothetical protein [Myxococcales bacterium]
MDLHDLEHFALADDRREALAQLVPGTEDYYFHRCLVEEQAGDLAAVERTLETWIDRHGQTGRVLEVRNRLALLRFDAQSDATVEYLRTTIDLRFDHQRVVEGQRPRHPTALPPEQIARDAVRRLGLAHSQAGDLAGFTDAALPWLAAEPLEGPRLRHLLSRLRHPSVPGLVDQVLAELGDRHSGGFGSLPIHGLLLHGQLDRLIERRPALLGVDAFVEAYLVKLQPGPDVDWEHDPAEHRALLERQWAFVSRLGERFGPLRAHVLYHRLELDRSEGVVDRERLLEYLRLPRQVPYANPAYLRRFSAPDARPFALGRDYRGATLHPPVGSDEALVRDCLAQVLRDQDDPAPFSDYLDTDFLHEVFATTKILAGVGDLERWTSLLGDPGRLAALKERVELRFAPTNRRWFGAHDEVSLDVDVKHVPVLTVKVFEIDPLAVFLA